MKITDRVYGVVEITEPVLIELINSKPVQRLKEINQHGAIQFLSKQHNVSRFEHSIGVMLFLKSIGASMEEQIAGLLHDVPHTAFSHVIDWVFPSEEHDFHEQYHEKIIMNSEIPVILAKYGFAAQKLFDKKRFHLLESKLPDVCADRIDYSMRDRIAKFGMQKHIPAYLQSFTVQNNQIIMKDRKTAEAFALDYLEMDKVQWGSSLSVASYKILSDAFKIAIAKNILIMEDFFGDDQSVIAKLKASKNPQILEKLELLNPKLAVEENQKEHDFYSKTKIRYVDPLFQENGVARRISEVSKVFKQQLEDHMQKAKKGTYIKIARK
ncbi:HD domain-containing protein [Candidatus Woesearchaeota archaeon]|nr:MAG: HD domain-containing protein [Candidatus Woesearchaeota archaeon]